MSNTFNFYRSIRKTTVRELVNTGINVRKAVEMTRKAMPYLFVGHAKCQDIDRDNEACKDYVTQLNGQHS